MENQPRQHAVPDRGRQAPPRVLHQPGAQVAAAREEERQRLGRDLHDSLGPMLDAVTQQADTARELVDRDPEQARALLGRLNEQTQSVLGEIRRLIYALRPPVPDTLGLPGAIQHVITAAAEPGLQVRLEAPQPFPALPIAIQLAAQRIVQEALANVVHHAQAQHCTVRLKLLRGLLIEVVDDGQGLLDQPRVGVGLRTVREQVRELGGACWIGRAWTGGTRVSAWLPLS